VKVFSNSTDDKVAVASLGMIPPNEWVDVDLHAEARYERGAGRTLEDSAVKGRFEVRNKPKTKKKETN
jgi:hypothetical protein